MAHAAADLETLAAAVLFGHRNTRLAVMNAFRELDGQDPVTYRINVNTLGEDVIEEAMENVESDAEAAVDADLAVVFTAALVKHRRFRLRLLNAFRVAGDKEPQEYYVNAYQPTPGEYAEALENVTGA